MAEEDTKRTRDVLIQFDDADGRNVPESRGGFSHNSDPESTGICQAGGDHHGALQNQRETGLQRTHSVNVIE
jgi:hypothetical protein